jgi:phosphoglycolate phosphatase
MSHALASPPKAVIFDWDNTLVDSWPVIHQALNETFQAYGKPLWTLEETKDRVRHSMRDSFPDLFGEKWQEAGEAYRTNYRHLHLTHLKPMPEAEELLIALAERGVLLGVISNKTGEILRKEVEILEWTEYFHRLIGSGDLKIDKPSPEPVRALLEPTGIAANDVWFVGDSIVDVECARASGCIVIFYGDRFHYDGGRVELRETELHAPTHRQLLEIVTGV